MSITLQLPSGDIVSADRPQAVIGSDPTCDVVVVGLQPQHATIRKIANRWMVESCGDWQIRVGDDAPGRKCWIEAGSPIHMDGLEITFMPDMSDARATEPPTPSRTGPPPLPTSNTASLPNATTIPPPLPPPLHGSWHRVARHHLREHRNVLIVGGTILAVAGFTLFHLYQPEHHVEPKTVWEDEAIQWHDAYQSFTAADVHFDLQSVQIEGEELLVKLTLTNTLENKVVHVAGDSIHIRDDFGNFYSGSLLSDDGEMSVFTL